MVAVKVVARLKACIVAVVTANVVAVVASFFFVFASQEKLYGA
jgi:hypothetical protein